MCRKIFLLIVLPVYIALVSLGQLCAQEEESEIIKMLIKDNSEMKTMTMEVVKSIQPNNNTTNNNNSHNTTNNNNHFNLQIYLNETCKDAMNMSDFIDFIKLAKRVNVQNPKLKKFKNLLRLEDLK